MMLSVLNNPALTRILGKLLGLMGRIVKGCVRKAQVSCILMYVYVAPPTPVGAWSMALGLRQHFHHVHGHTLYLQHKWVLSHSIALQFFGGKVFNCL